MIYKNLDLSDIKYFCDIDLIWKTEQWENVKGYENIYMISDLSRVKSLERSQWCVMNNSFSIRKQRMLSQSIGSSGRLHSHLKINNKSKSAMVHQLVAIAFLNHVPCGYEMVVDHKNNNPLDNRLVNLQLITQRENVIKSLNNKNASSKYIGVVFDKQAGNWRARISINGVRKHLGSFDCEEKAGDAYINAFNKTIEKL